MKKRKKIIAGISVAIVFWGVLMAFLFPAGSNPLVAQSASLAMQGKSFNHLLSWFELRRMTGELDVDPVAFSNSTAFAQTVLKMLPGTYDIRTDCWNIAVELPGDVDDDFPVLISANFNPVLLRDDLDESGILPLGLESGASLSLLDDRYVVVIRKNGTANIILAKLCTRDRILGASKNVNRKIVYLTPHGKVDLQICGSFRR